MLNLGNLRRPMIIGVATIIIFAGALISLLRTPSAPREQPTAVTEAERQAKTEAERQAKTEAERQAKTEAERQAKTEAERQSKTEAGRQAKTEAERTTDEAREPALTVIPGSGKPFRDRLADGNPCPMCPEMVVVPAGVFIMGSSSSENGASAKEGPQHSVTIARPFAVGRFAVTFAEWDACVTDGRSCSAIYDEGWGRRNRPVINIQWRDAKNYVAWLSRKTGKTYRLLSEAEREYATRAGTTTSFWWGSSISTSQANYDDSGTLSSGAKGGYRAQTVPVGQFEPNPWGLYNVETANTVPP
jgi:formylglycine-generating enzyme required for sulfatase activity